MEDTEGHRHIVPTCQRTVETSNNVELKVLVRHVVVLIRHVID